MSTKSNHPPAEHLKAYLIGGLSDADFDLVGGHLEECHECVQAATQLEIKDPLVKLLSDAAKRTYSDLEANPIIDTVFASIAQKDTDAPGIDPPDFDHQIPAALLNHPRYRVRQMLGRGSMGTVWLAEHLLLNRFVAIKCIHPEFLSKPGAAERLRREMHAAAKLQHPNVVSALDAETSPNISFLVTEYVEGKTLAQLLAEGPFTIDHACCAARDAALGLAHAHASGLIHRDVKPANLIEGTTGQVKLLDLGLVAPLVGQSDLTGENMVMGTPDYVSPEQALDPRSADARSDIYSLGCTLYHLLAGKPPFVGPSALSLLDAHRWQAAPRPLGLPDELWSILNKMLAKRTEDRFSSAGEVAAALAPFCHSDYRPKEMAASVSKGDRQSRRTSIAIAIGLVAIFALLAGGVVYRIQTDRGELIIETLDDNIKVEIKQKGKVITVLDVKSGQKLTLRSGKYEVSGSKGKAKVLFEPGEIRIVRGGVIARIRQIRIMEEQSNSIVSARANTQRIGNLNKAVSRLVWSKDGTMILLSCHDGSAQVWDRATGVQLQRLEHRLDRDYSNQISSIQLFADDKKLLTTNRFGIYAWDLKSESELSMIPAPEDDILQLAEISDDKKLIACGSGAGKIRVWNAQTKELIKVFEGNGKPAYHVKWMPGSHRLVMGQDIDLRVVDFDNGKELMHSVDGGIWLECSVDVDRSRFAVILWNGWVVIFDSNTFKEISRFPCRHVDNMSHYAMSYLPDGRIATGGGTMLDLSDPDTGSRLHSFEGMEQKLLSLAVSPDGKWIAASGEQGEVRVWEIPRFASEAKSK